MKIGVSGFWRTKAAILACSASSSISSGGWSCSLSMYCPCARTSTMTGSFCCVTGAALACGSSMSTPRFNSGAVTMKMISSTSITSMYGTTLMSALSRRLRMRRPVAVWAMAILSWCLIQRPKWTMGSIVQVRLALQDRSELLAKRVVTRGDAVDLGSEAVVGPYRRDRGEQAHRSRDQRLGNTRRHGGDRRLLDVGQALERNH